MTANIASQPYNEAVRVFFLLHPDATVHAELTIEQREVEVSSDFWNEYANDISENWYPAFALAFALGALNEYDASPESHKQH